MEGPRRSTKRKTIVSPYLIALVLLSGLLPVIWSLVNAGASHSLKAEEDLILPSSFQSHSSDKPVSLQDLTNTHNNHQHDEADCLGKSFVYIHDVVSTSESSSQNTARKIPKIIHQTSKSRCLTKMFAQVSNKWRSLEGYDYFLHDDHAMVRLLSTEFEEFPMLHDLVMANCLPHGTLKADIWRYLVLWEFGGIYADIDTQPTALFNTTVPVIQDDDGWFVVEQFHILSQYVMAVSPHHPLMYYAVQHSVNKVMAQVDTKKSMLH